MFRRIGDHKTSPDCCIILINSSEGAQRKMDKLPFTAIVILSLFLFAGSQHISQVWQVQCEVQPYWSKSTEGDLHQNWQLHWGKIFCSDHEGDLLFEWLILVWLVGWLIGWLIVHYFTTNTTAATRDLYSTSVGVQIKCFTVTLATCTHMYAHMCKHTCMHTFANTYACVHVQTHIHNLGLQKCTLVTPVEKFRV